MPNLPVIPETITVHLGAPNAPAANVTVPFTDYIKNVASSEIYPTWPESAIRANIYAQISYALNRVYTEYYRSRGYDFDITNSTAYDQSFVYGRDIFDNISAIVDDIFDSYIRRQGSVAPLFAAYCDGIRVSCDGLSQWGTVSLAEAGKGPYDILTDYYGNDIDIVTDVPIGPSSASTPFIPLRFGSAGADVELLQIRLNRIGRNYPGIPKIYPVNGIFDQRTENAVREFQKIFSLTEDGVVGRATWYKVLAIYTGVKRLSELNAEGLSLSEVSTQFPEVLRRGSTGLGVRVLQYYLSYISAFVPSVPGLTVDGVFGDDTENAVYAFQNAYGLTPDGIVGESTWNSIYNVYKGLVASLPLSYTDGLTVPFPGDLLALGSEGEAVKLLQEYLNYIRQSYPQIPALTEDGVYGPATQYAVTVFQDIFGVQGTPGVVGSVTWEAITSVYDDVYNSNRASEGQYPGYTVGE